MRTVTSLLATLLLAGCVTYRTEPHPRIGSFTDTYPPVTGHRVGDVIPCYLDGESAIYSPLTPFGFTGSRYAWRVWGPLGEYVHSREVVRLCPATRPAPRAANPPSSTDNRP